MSLRQLFKHKRSKAKQNVSPGTSGEQSIADPHPEREDQPANSSRSSIIPSDKATAELAADGPSAELAEKPSRADKYLDMVEKLPNMLSPYMDIGGKDLVDEGVSMLANEVSHFAENSRTLVSVLDALGQAHPFIQAGVAIFKIGINLELARRENNDRVVALNVAMCDMMSTLKLLQDIPDTHAEDASGDSVAKRLIRRMGDRGSGIIGSMLRCARLCDSYHKRIITVRILTSLKWKDRFLQLAQEFDEHKAGIQFDLQLHAAITMASVDANVRELKNMVAMLQSAFEVSKTPEECEIASFIKENGGQDKVQQDEVLLNQILVISASQKSLPNRQPTAREVQREIRKSLDVVLAEDARAFDNKFKLMEEEVKTGSARTGHQADRTRADDRIIASVISGPADSILNRDMFQVWRENGWRGSVEIGNLLAALHDHYSRLINMEREVQPAKGAFQRVAVVDSDFPSSSEHVADDAWSLRFMNALRANQFIEFIARGIGGEQYHQTTGDLRLNDGDSVPRWFAFSTIGTELATGWYFRRIALLMKKIDQSIEEVLPINRVLINRFVEGLEFVDRLICGLGDSKDHLDDIDWESNDTFSKFRSYIDDQEERMAAALRTVAYHLDDENTLRLVTGEREPERHALPLTCLLLRRALCIVEDARISTLGPELQMVEESLHAVSLAVEHRLDTLEAVYRLRKLNPKEECRTFFHGIFSCIRLSKVPSGTCWTAGSCRYHLPEDDFNPAFPPEPASQEIPSAHHIPLLSGRGEEDPSQLEQRQSIGARSATSDDENHGIPSVQLAGRWLLASTLDASGDSSSNGLFMLDIFEQDSDGSFVGVFRGPREGVTRRHPVEGSVRGRLVAFHMRYPDFELDYRGTLDTATDAIYGTWSANSKPGGKFRMKRPGAVDVSFRPLEEFLKNAVPPQNLLPDSEDTVIHSIPADLPGSSSTSTLIGHWWAEFAYAVLSRQSGVISTTSHGPVSIHFYGRSADGAVTGAGVDMNCCFTVRCTSNDNRISLRRTNDDSTTQDCEGVLDVASQEIRGTWGTEEWGGTFRMSRLTAVHHLLSAPRDGFLQNLSQARARWQWAIDAVIRFRRATPGQLQSDVLRYRRNYRNRYTNLVLRQGYVGHLSQAQAEWRALVKTIHPYDLFYWRLRAKFSAARQLVHTRISCSSCYTRGLQGARYTCLECCAGDEVSGTVDLCSACCSSSVDRIEDAKHHDPGTHRLLQLRMVVHPSLQYDVIQAGRNLAGLLFANRVVEAGLGDNIAETARPPCANCRTIIPMTHQRFWCCLTCEGSVFICYECNAKVERRKPWLFEHKLHSDPEHFHDWSHTLVLVLAPPNRTDVSGRELVVSSEADRLAHLESRVEALHSEMSHVRTQLDEVTSLLRSLVAAKTAPQPS